MGLNIKNAETHRLAIQLAQLTGETLTRTVSPMYIGECVDHGGCPGRMPRCGPYPL
jgi:hypothetical protein